MNANIISDRLQTNKQLAILIPCYNEAPTIAKVVGDFKREFPESTIYVFDNCSNICSTMLRQIII